MARKSRLQRVETKKAKRSAFLYIILSIIVVGLLLKYGITGVSKFVGLIADFSGDQTENNGDSNGSFVATPVLYDLPKYTTNDTIVVRGKTTSGYTAYIYINDVKTEVLANADGEFSTKVELSRAKENKIYAIIEDRKGNLSKLSKIYTVQIDDINPEVEIITPKSGDTFYGESNRSIKIEGQTESTAKLTFNDRVVIVRSNGKFDITVKLNEGENKFSIKAVDEAGNEVEIELILHFNS